MYTASPVSSVGRAARWLADLDNYQVQFLILDADHGRALLAAARTHPSWNMAYEDRDTVILTRAHTQSVIQAAAA